MSFLWYWPKGGWDFDAWKKTHAWAPVKSEQSGKRDPLPLARDWRQQADHWRGISDAILGKLTDRPPSKMAWEFLGDELSRPRDPAYTMQRLRYRLTDDEWGYAWLLRPTQAKEKCAAVIALHQTNPHGKNEPVGLEDIPENAESGLRYAVDLAERGFIVLAPDAIAFGERSGGHQNAKYHSADEFFAAHPEGSVMGKMSFDVSRAVDLLEHLPNVDPTRISCIGHSHGAYGTLFAMLHEPRIGAGVISCGFNLLRHDPRPERWWRMTALMPRLGFYENHIEQTPIDFHHWLALLAPRPVIVIAGTEDTIFPECAKLPPAMEMVKDVYALHGAKENFRFELFQGPHKFPAQLRPKAYDLIKSAITALAIPATNPKSAIRSPQSKTPGRSFPVPDTKLPFINGMIEKTTFAGRPHLVSGVWGDNAGGRIYFWNPRTKTQAMRALPKSSPGAYVLRTAPDGRLYLADGKGDLYRYDPAADRIDALVTGALSGISWGGCATDRYIIWSTDPGEAAVYDWREQRQVKKISPVDSLEPHAHYGHQIVEAPDGKVLFFMDIPQLHVSILDPADLSVRSIMPKSLEGHTNAIHVTFFDEHNLFLGTSNPKRGFQLLSYPGFELIDGIEPPEDYTVGYGRGCRIGDSYYAVFGPPRGTLWRISNRTRKWEKLIDAWLGEETGYLGAFDDQTLCAITVSGKALSLDIATGRTDEMQIDNPGQLEAHAMCAVPERNLIIGSPFINARFWSIDTTTGAGRDLGRGMPGGGQINQIVWDAGRHVALMSSYTEAAISEYDPVKPASWPQNPRLVASAKSEHQLRPRALVFDRRFVWMATSADYGKLGGALSRIDPQTSEIKVWRNIVPDQTINALALDLPRRRIYLSSEIYADCESAPPTQSAAQVVAFDMDNLAVICRQTIRDAAPSLGVMIILPDGRVLVHEENNYFAWDADSKRIDALGKLKGCGAVVADENGSLWSTVGGWIGRMDVGRDSIRFTPAMEHGGGQLQIEDDILYYATGATIHATPLDELRNRL